jgi:hypothetical protein
MQRKTAQEYNPLNYACYAVTGITEDFTINTVHPSGLKEYVDYDLYDIGEKTLIAFTKLNIHKVDFVYRIVSENYVEEIFCENYEFIQDVLNNNYDDDRCTFLIMRSAGSYNESMSGEVVSVDASRRCDTDDLDVYAAVDFYDVNKENASDICDRNYFGNDSILGWTVIISSMSNIYIVKLVHRNMDDRAYKEWPIRVSIAQSFPHVMKMAYEWSTLSEEPWQAEDSIALKCKQAFADWNIPNDAIEELIESQPDTVLGLFLNGDSNPRKSIEENKNIPEKFKNWFTGKLRYRTLGSIMQSYPSTLSIPDSMIEKEKIFFEEQIYKFCVENKLNLATITGNEILNKAYSLGPKDINNGIVDIIQKSIYLDDINTIQQSENERKNAFLISAENLHR